MSPALITLVLNLLNLITAFDICWDVAPRCKVVVHHVDELSLVPHVFEFLWSHPPQYTDDNTALLECDSWPVRGMYDVTRGEVLVLRYLRHACAPSSPRRVSLSFFPINE